MRHETIIKVHSGGIYSLLRNCVWLKSPFSSNFKACTVKKNSSHLNVHLTL